jgi:uncharacterized protein involved in oxidation of intracellular sulfur
MPPTGLRKLTMCCAYTEAGGIAGLPFIEGVRLSNMKEFAQWTVECDKVFTF